MMKRPQENEIIKFEYKPKNMKVYAPPLLCSLLIYTPQNPHLWINYDLLNTSQNTRDGENMVEFRSYILQRYSFQLEACGFAKKCVYNLQITLVNYVYRQTLLRMAKYIHCTSLYIMDTA